jgi:parallel beta-helix repeat protein
MDNDDLNPSQYVQYVIFDGIDFDARGITHTMHFYSGARHIRFQNGEIRNSIKSCVAQQASDIKLKTDLQFINMNIHHCGVPFDTNMINGILARKHPSARFRHPWYMHAGGNSLINSETSESAGTGLGPAGDDNIIVGNYIHDNTGQGIYIAAGNNWKVCNNVFYNNGIYEIYHGSGINHIICNNTVVAGPRDEGQIGAGIYLTQGASASVYENNIVDGFWAGVMNYSNGSPITFRNNLIRSSHAPGYEFFYEEGTKTIKQNNILNRDPLFVNKAAGDFRLQSNSPAIGNGADGGNIGATIDGDE